MTSQQVSLFTDYEINGKALHNRFAVAPMTRVSATAEGLANERMARYYERFAKGGFSLVVTEGIYTDKKFAQGYQFQPGLSDHAQAESWRQVVARMHDHDALIFAQLMHAGALSQGNRFVTHTAGPSAVQPKGKQIEFYYGSGDYPLPTAMTDSDISDAIDGFVQSAQRSVEVAGFDGIEIHGANGYLLDQFMTDYTNHRNDSWGGSVQRRLALTLEVIKRTRKTLGNQVPIGVRISQSKVNDYEHKWAGGEKDAEVIFGMLAQAGVDYIHVTEYKAWKPAFSDSHLSLVALAKRYSSGTTIIANGALHEPSRAEQVLNDGADIVTLGKGALSNADFPNKLQRGQSINPINTEMLGPIANLKDYELEL
ncbi:MAG: NADH:flavin oxidoreductase [Alteromonadaceae bacterium]|jgi:2,4-dienoyl-CoA reductase-like NADH-dependent reductase (Old Yellow Enzyme family)|uniref:NADH:flavin oxidoreductase n=1 Tax=unclassified Methylophaga TaxID=2629249 RepID=UPI000C6629D3|nr:MULTISPECIES: NADH:flavin oxidoreductase [unclassified Methylophaga]MAP27013.1 NADH:flavin oxidoreductase [Methylophaga sp.]MBN24779.1 NADH:flavin oxidoreductase [Alteromonadaceae bacterium]|tara:strand:+ start:12969 stop:14072 length:1104 start_codon:yes stop_codon:yes gene_type:complete